MYTLLISGLILFTSAHVASVALTNYVVDPKPAIVGLLLTFRQLQKPPLLVYTAGAVQLPT